MNNKKVGYPFHRCKMYHCLCYYLFLDVSYFTEKKDDEAREYKVSGELSLFPAAERELNAMRRYSNIDYLVCVCFTMTYFLESEF